MGLIAVHSQWLAQAAVVALCASTGSAQQTTSNTAIVNLASQNSTLAHLASGFIYGIPDSGFSQSPNQIPSSFYSAMGFNYARSGGAQETQGGWIVNKTAYAARFQSTLQNYQTARAHGARFQILPHDLWGTDHATSSSYWPGDNGNWTLYDNFLTQLMSDIVSNNMLPGLDYDLWNEPDGGFWDRTEAQYLAMWNRTYHTFRASSSAVKSVPIVGPSSAHAPALTNSWWTTWIQYVVSNSVIPDQYTWHEEPGDPATDVPNLAAVLAKYKAPTKPININEYATYSQQNAAGAAWWISRLERYGLIGLRGNWLSTCQLHDFLASLLGKTNDNSCTGTGYFGNGEWQVYKYYNQNMTGVKAATTGSTDGKLDVYSTVGGGKVKALTGVLTSTGTWYLTFANLTSVGLPASGTLNVQTYGLVDKGHFTAVGDPTTSNRGIYGHKYSGGSVTFPIYQTSADEYTAWAFEFST